MKKAMARRNRSKIKVATDQVDSSSSESLTWLRAAYELHTFAYRDPRAAFSSAVGLPVVSPTAVLLGIVSTLFCCGQAAQAHDFLKVIHNCHVAIDPPKGVIFFRAFHQLRRYHSTTKGRTERAGLTSVNQGTREYGLVDGPITIFVGVPERFGESVKFALRNRDHLGTHDSLCSLVGDVQNCLQPDEVVFLPPEQWQAKIPAVSPVTVMMLARFRSPIQAASPHWWLAGGEDTEIVPYLVQGRFFGTTRGKIYRKS